MNSKDKGDLGELIVMQQAMLRGHTASMPYGDNKRYDLILDINGNLQRVQVKHYRPKNGKIEISLCTVMHNKDQSDNRKYKRVHYQSSEIDSLAVVNADTNEVYLVPESEFRDLKTISLRITSSNKNHPKIRWASDYLDW